MSDVINFVVDDQIYKIMSSDPNQCVQKMRYDLKKTLLEVYQFKK